MANTIMNDYLLGLEFSIPFMKLLYDYQLEYKDLEEYVEPNVY